MPITQARQPSQATDYLPARSPRMQHFRVRPRRLRPIGSAGQGLSTDPRLKQEFLTGALTGRTLLACSRQQGTTMPDDGAFLDRPGIALAIAAADFPRLMLCLRPSLSCVHRLPGSTGARGDRAFGGWGHKVVLHAPPPCQVATIARTGGIPADQGPRPQLSGQRDVGQPKGAGRRKRCGGNSSLALAEGKSSLHSLLEISPCTEPKKNVRVNSVLVVDADAYTPPCCSPFNAVCWYQ
jgi:hypothetical protein